MVSKSQNGGLRVKGESIQCGRDHPSKGSVIDFVVDESGGTSFEASSTIFPNVQLNAMSPTVSTLWNAGRPNPFSYAWADTAGPPSVTVKFPLGSMIRGIPNPECNTLTIQAALKHCICKRGISTLSPHFPTLTILPSFSTSPSPPNRSFPPSNWELLCCRRISAHSR
jgi:hypothetical protein